MDRSTTGLDGLNVIAKITFGGLLHLRTAKEKRGYKGPLFYANPGDLVISKIRVSQGSFCVVPDELEHLAVSPEYPVYEVDHTRVTSSFIRLAIRTEAFRCRVAGLRSGNTTKGRIRPAEFESLTIPLPDIEEQERLANAYFNCLKDAANQEAHAVSLEQEAINAFEEALGVTPPAPLPDRPLFIARFKDFERWSHEGILTAGNGEIHSEKWPMVSIGEVGKVTYGIQKCPANRPGMHARPYLRVANVQRGMLDLSVIKFINVPDEEMQKLMLERGDLLLCEGNSADLVGRGAIWNGEIDNCVHQNHILKVRLDKKTVLPAFVLAVINCSLGQAYFRSKAKRTTNLASINSREVSGLPFPLPPINIQESLVMELNSAKQKVEELQSKAAALRKSAWNLFELALFETANGE